jgi:DNA-binding NarL/FixJ family response regulator
LIVQGIRDVYAGKLTIDSDLATKLIGFVSDGSDTLPAYEALTDREVEVLTLAGKGYTNKAVGHELSISRRTVQGHLARIFKKLEVNNRTEAVMRAVSLGLIIPENEG